MHLTTSDSFKFRAYAHPARNRNWRASKEKCKPCWDLELKPKPQEPIPSPWQQDPEPPASSVPQPRDARPYDHEACIAAVKEVASLLARNNEVGFQHLTHTGTRVKETATNTTMYMALLRLGLIADQEQLCVESLKKASHWRRQAGWQVPHSLEGFAESQRCRKRNL